TGTSASGAACVPSPGSPCFTDQTLVVMVTAAPPPALQSVVSRKVHAGAGTFDLPLSLQPTAPTVEPRISGAGGAHTIVFVFDQALVSGQAAVTEGIATMGTPTFSGNEMRVPLSAVNNAQYVTVAVNNVASATSSGGSGSARIGFLL